MKRYDRRHVLKDAHRLYKNEYQRKGRSWSECLKAAWSWEPGAVKVREEKRARLDAMIAASWSAHSARINESSCKKASFLGFISWCHFICDGIREKSILRRLKQRQMDITEDNLHLLNGRLANVSNLIKTEIWVTMLHI